VSVSPTSHRLRKPPSHPTLRLILQPIGLVLLFVVLVRASLFRIYAIPSASMAPTLQPGDRILATLYHQANGVPHPDRGDVVVFHSVAGGEEMLVKRIVGLPGDLLELRQGRLFVSGHALAEPYLRITHTTGLIVPQIIPADCYFVLGDNRPNSFDSRNWGVLPARMMIGRARMVLWSSANVTAAPQANAAARFLNAARAGVGSRFFQPIR
jgi:signal peptidase I, bacterial type